MFDIYRIIGPIYDLVSGEWPVYRTGRIAGIEALGLSAGDTVVDADCGTGLSLPLLAEDVDPVDTSSGSTRPKGC